MSEKSDDSIERFFRKVVVQQDKTFMERDWHSMEKMLDAQAALPSAQGVIRSRVVILAISIAFLFFIGSETQTDPGSVQVQAAVGRGGPRIKVNKENPTADLYSFSNAGEPSKQKNPSGQNSNTTLSGAAQSVASRTTSTSQSGLASNTLSTDKSNLSQETASANDRAQINDLSTSDGARGQMPEQLFSNSSSVTTPSAEVAQDNAADSIGTVSKKAADVSEAQQKEEEPLTATPRLLVTGLISPDFSSTSLTKYSKPSGVFGILLGYKISKRFTIMTGVTKSLKKYEGYGNEYSPPEGYWNNRTNGVVPDEVEGKCGIIEIPLLVQYDVLQRSRSRIFVSGGVSSYFMRSENYQYTFLEPNPGAANSWTAKEPSQYLFKIGHVSAGYDRMITRNLSVGIEPFLKLPFQGIGWTDINLYSTGAYINLRYTILRTHQ